MQRRRMGELGSGVRAALGRRPLDKGLRQNCITLADNFAQPMEARWRRGAGAGSRAQRTSLLHNSPHLGRVLGAELPHALKAGVGGVGCFLVSTGIRRAPRRRQKGKQLSATKRTNATAGMAGNSPRGLPCVDGTDLDNSAVGGRTRRAQHLTQSALTTKLSKCIHLPK